MTSNDRLAKALRDIGYLSEVEDAAHAQFKALAYYRAADSIESLSIDVGEIYSRGGIEELLEIKGIGKAIAGKIDEFIKRRGIHQLEDLKKRLPIDTDQMSSIEYLGPKTVSAIYKALGITNLAGLEAAAREGRLKTVPGISAKKEQDILKRIEFAKKSGGRRMIGEVWPLAKAIESRLQKLDGVFAAALAGSARRMKETVGDLDFIVTSDDAGKVIDFFTNMPEVEEVKGKGPVKAFVRLEGGIDADVLVIPKESWGSALLYFTGSKDHNVELRRIALEKKLRLNEWGVFEAGGKKRVAGYEEEEIYRTLDLQWIPPEMRENVGEIGAAAKKQIPDLIPYGSLRGDLQVHSKSTDGAATIEEMARAAKEFGLDYIALTDHTKTLALAHGLDANELLDQASKIVELNDRLEGFRVLASAEVNILKDGSLDIPGNVLDRLDIVGAAIHSNFNLPKEVQTARLVAAAKNPSVDIIFHPTGRLINWREGYIIDIERLVETARDSKTVLEIDAHYNRLDLKDEYVRLAVESGVRLVIDSDAHHPVHFAFLQFGVGQARRGWAKPSDILNTLDADELLKAMK